jgi:hypothetical protein
MPHTSNKKEGLKKEFWQECAEKFNDSQEWLFELVADWWLEKLALSRQEGREGLRKELVATVSNLKGVADMEIRDGAWLVEQKEVIDIILSAPRHGEEKEV